MTRRERVEGAIGFRETDFVPYHVGLTAAAREKLAAYLGTKDVDEAIGNHLLSVSARRAAVWREERPGFWRDEFGVLWDRTIDQDIGNPV